MGIFVHRTEVKQVSWGKSIPHREQQVQRPWGRQSSLRLEEKQKPLWLEQRIKDRVVEVG